MISYKPFFDTLLRKNVTEYELIFKHGVSVGGVHYLGMKLHAVKLFILAGKSRNGTSIGRGVYLEP